MESDREFSDDTEKPNFLRSLKSSPPTTPLYNKTHPRNPTNAYCLSSKEKRIMERELLCALEPKEKEHQRKKVLRIFFTWLRKNHTIPLPQQKLWEWVYSLNPDNTASDERYKSMSYQFLDRLLCSPEFREVLMKWVDQYEIALSGTEEDVKTKLFLKFIRHSIHAKDIVEKEMTQFKRINMINEPCYDTAEDAGVLAIPTLHPQSPGAYLEIKCSNSRCREFKRKFYVHVVANKVFDFFRESAKCSCHFCCTPLREAFGLGFFECKWGFSGQTVEDRLIKGALKYSHAYCNFYEFSFYDWASLLVAVAELNPIESDFLKRSIPETLITQSQILSLPSAALEGPQTHYSHSTQTAPQRSLSAEAQTELHSLRPGDSQSVKNLTIFFLGKHVRHQNEELEELRKKLKKFQDKTTA